MREPTEPSEEADETSVAVPPASFVRAGLLFYGVMAVVAVLWRAGLYGEDILLAPAATSSQLSPLRDVAIGLAFGAVVVGASELATRRTQWGERLARALARGIGGLSLPDALLLALASGLAEEMFFRGALQPRVGWVAASLLFGLVHFLPRREFYPWTGFAIVVGFALGGLFIATGNLVAPVVAHVFINAVNLPMLLRRHGSPSPD